MWGNPIPTDFKFCPKWETHTEPGTRWIHLSFHKQLEDKKDMVPSTSKMMEENPQLIAS